MAILKLFHIFAVCIWIGSLLSLSRILVFQSKQSVDIQRKVAGLLKKLYFAVELPAMLLTICLGMLSLFVKGITLKAPWLHMKLTFVFLLIVCDFIVGRKIVLHSRKPQIGSPFKLKIFHAAAICFFTGILVAIYVIKPR